MPCYNPLRGFRTPTTGRLQLQPSRDTDDFLQVPCGNCIGCRLDRSKHWAIRCVHEAQLHEENSFLTMTYAPEHLPPGGTLNPKDVQAFLHRMRVDPKIPRIRYFYAGEYGDLTGRPHYHMILFGYRFPDEVHEQNRNGLPVFSSKMLESKWQKGRCETGTVTFQSAGYVARYITKKITGKDAEKHYNGKTPEYCSMSLRPGIGREWLEKYWQDVYPGDYVIIDGQRYTPPRYYDKWFAEKDPKAFEEIQARREQFANDHMHDNTDKRLDVRNECAQHKANRLIRPLEISNE